MNREKGFLKIDNRDIKFWTNDFPESGKISNLQKQTKITESVEKIETILTNFFIV